MLSNSFKHTVVIAPMKESRQGGMINVMVIYLMGPFLKNERKKKPGFQLYDHSLGRERGTIFPSNDICSVSSSIPNLLL